jgi:hypothetical protein
MIWTIVLPVILAVVVNTLLALLEKAEVLVSLPDGMYQLRVITLAIYFALVNGRAEKRGADNDGD